MGFIALLLAFSACQEPPETTVETVEEVKVVDTLTQLDHIMARGKLVAVTNCAFINYNMYSAKPSGFEYDLLRDFCNSLHINLELIVNDNLDSCFRMLDSCQVDVMATGVGLTKSLKQHYLASTPLMSQRCVLVQRLPKGWHSMSTDNEVESHLLRSPLELAGKTIQVPCRSHAAEALSRLSDAIGDTIIIVENDTLGSLQLIEAVANGSIDYAVVDEYVARMALVGKSGLDMKLAVSVEQPIGWALRQTDNDSSVLMAINNWINNVEKQQLQRIMTRYIKNGTYVSARVESADHISDFDAAIQKTAKAIGWDWRLLASLIYQESRFETELESEKGAYGLMQLMPAVMEQFDIDYDATPEEQIVAGGKLIISLDKALQDRVTDSVERIKFVLAAYNAGLGHIYDAQRLAEKYGKDPCVWDNNVDYFLLNKSRPQYFNDTCCRNGCLNGVQTYRFVEEVTERWHHYQNLVH